MHNFKVVGLETKLVQWYCWQRCCAGFDSCRD